MKENSTNCMIQPLFSLSTAEVAVDVLRLDRVHTVVSGNKWFKLKYYLQDAIASGAERLASFGGPWSNHIVAVAYAAQEAGKPSIGYIRGNRPPVLSPTLADAEMYGMELVFMERNAYGMEKHRKGLLSGIYYIPEGGSGEHGVRGASEIFSSADLSAYTHIVCAIGTGTMMAGLVREAAAGQTVEGICIMKNAGAEEEVRALAGPSYSENTYSIIHGYDFGGYAKHPPELIAFMNRVWERERLPTDIVYTSKMLFAVNDLVAKGHYPAGSKVLAIHSGGLQGNRSLEPGILLFS